METLIVKKNNRIIFSSELKGLRPLAEFISKKSLEGCTVYDKVVGEAAARIYCFYKVKKVECELASVPAIKLFEETNIPFKFKEKTEQILRMDKKGICPGELDSMNFERDSDFIEFLKKKYQ